MNGRATICSWLAMVVLSTGAPLQADEVELLAGRIESVPPGSQPTFTVKSLEGEWKIQCSEKTVFVREGKNVLRDSLKPKQHVLVSGLASDQAVKADRVELTDAVEGKIEAIMEVFPLRLSVKGKTGETLVQLQEDTRILRRGKVVVPGQLKNGDTVCVFGSLSKGLFAAKVIHVEMRR